MPRKHNINADALYTIKAQQEVLDAELAVKWTQIKIKLSDWLLNSTSNITPSNDFRMIKCCVDSICGLNKLIGAQVEAPVDPSELPRTTDRTESLLKRLDAASGNIGTKSASGKKKPKVSH